MRVGQIVEGNMRWSPTRPARGRTTGLSGWIRRPAGSSSDGLAATPSVHRFCCSRTLVRRWTSSDHILSNLSMMPDYGLPLLVIGRPANSALAACPPVPSSRAAIALACLHRTDRIKSPVRYSSRSRCLMAELRLHY